MPTVIILGAYGLIGSACVRAFAAAGYTVIGLGRSKHAARSMADVSRWVFADLVPMTDLDWAQSLNGVDVVVNAAGALQDGPRDDLEAIHVRMPEALCRALTPDQRLVQISAAGVAMDASTAFFRSKARGDAAVRKTAPNWVILKPTLVLSPEAYGGTALLRGAAALPGILPTVLPDTRIQTVHVDDLAAAVVKAAGPQVPTGTTADITAPEDCSLSDLMGKIRAWQGFSPARFHPSVPGPFLTTAGFAADIAGRLGWRSPLRSTALIVLRDGVHGDPAKWSDLGGKPCRSLDETLRSLPSTRQERLYGRFYFALPIAIITLSIFWVASGLIALAHPAAGAAYLDPSVLPRWLIHLTVIGGAVADIGIGAAILWRPWCRAAALSMVGLAALYLIGGAIAAPDLWADPLGPMLKVFPGLILALLVWLGVEQR